MAVAIQSILNTYFLQISGLLALLGLIPLVIFYLVRKKPEEQIMPSMAFFMQKKKGGKAHQAFRFISRNWILIFHILMISGFAAALAHPYFEAPVESEKSVIIMDYSASMSDDLEEARKFAVSNLGEDNTLVTVDNQVNIPMEEASPRKVKSYLRGLKASDTETDIGSALEIASDFSGEIVVASDLDQTVSDKSPGKIIDNLRNSDRTLKLMESAPKNSWGIINVKPGEPSSSIDVKNFENEKRKIRIIKDGSGREIDMEAGEVKTVTVNTSPGKNKIKLEEDRIKADNTAYISVPEQQNYDVTMISRTGNRYLEKAIELISFADIKTVEPPVEQELESDVYLLGRTDRILSKTIDSIESDVKKGASMVVLSHEGVFNYEFEKLPVKGSGEKRNISVQLTGQRNLDLGKMEIQKSRITGGESYSNPEEALVSEEYGKGEVFFYNLNPNFKFDFMYPVIWKDILSDVTDRPSIQELNLETGEEISGKSIQAPSGKESGTLEMESSGFYTEGEKVYAANLESEAESFAEPTEQLRQQSDITFENRDIQHLTAILLLFLLLGEMGYLVRIGDA